MTTDNAPFFHALAVFACKANRLYRIYVRQGELVFIWAGRGGEGLAGARAVSQRGGLYTLLGGAMQLAFNPSKSRSTSCLWGRRPHG
jgi:hypothetical protein